MLFRILLIFFHSSNFFFSILPSATTHLSEYVMMISIKSKNKWQSKTEWQHLRTMTQFHFDWTFVYFDIHVWQVILFETVPNKWKIKFNYILPYQKLLTRWKVDARILQKNWYQSKKIQISSVHETMAFNWRCHKLSFDIRYDFLTFSISWAITNLLPHTIFLRFAQSFQIRSRKGIYLNFTIRIHQ